MVPLLPATTLHWLAIWERWFWILLAVTRSVEHTSTFLLRSSSRFWPPTRYDDKDLAYIAPRVLELTYTANDITPWARISAMKVRHSTLIRNAGRCCAPNWTQVCAPLRAYSGGARYILDPASVMGPDYPSETFRVLKNSEEKEFGEYRTQRLVLAAWDALEHDELH